MRGIVLHTVSIGKAAGNRFRVEWLTYLSIYPGVSAAMAGIYFIPAETAQLDPENKKYKASLKEKGTPYVLMYIKAL